MLLQWQDELAQKFGLDFTIVDREHLMETRRTRGFSANDGGLSLGQAAIGAAHLIDAEAIETESVGSNMFQPWKTDHVPRNSRPHRENR